MDRVQNTLTLLHSLRVKSPPEANIPNLKLTCGLQAQGPVLAQLMNLEKKSVPTLPFLNLQAPRPMQQNLDALFISILHLGNSFPIPVPFYKMPKTIFPPHVDQKLLEIFH